DCDDSNVATFPGAAELDDPIACMHDEDDDGYGDQRLPAGAAAGSGCADASVEIFMCTLWCPDNDGDGLLDDSMCVGVPPGEEPPEFFEEYDGTNGGDCDDTNPFTFPGAAEIDDPNACMLDADEDGWGDDFVDEMPPD